MKPVFTEGILTRSCSRAIMSSWAASTWAKRSARSGVGMAARPPAVGYEGVAGRSVRRAPNGVNAGGLVGIGIRRIWGFAGLVGGVSIGWLLWVLGWPSMLEICLSMDWDGTYVLLRCY